MAEDEYNKQQFARVTKLYNRTKHICFLNGSEMADWYIKQLSRQEYKCYYCETSIQDINQLIDALMLKSRAVRGGGRRGPVLEIDKMENQIGYTLKNCVLACYYCNNDKSYSLDSQEYKTHFGMNRKIFHRLLLDGLLATLTNYPKLLYD